MASKKTPAEYIFNNLEARYEAAREAQANGQISESELLTAAYRATEAAQILAQQKKWELPFFK
jgi:hypothetical protein